MGTIVIPVISIIPVNGFPIIDIIISDIVVRIVIVVPIVVILFVIVTPWPCLLRVRTPLPL
jgi:hypothetical protein